MTKLTLEVEFAKDTKADCVFVKSVAKLRVLVPSRQKPRA
jgi:hypothetical protein